MATEFTAEEAEQFDAIIRDFNLELISCDREEWNSYTPLERATRVLASELSRISETRGEDARHWCATVAQEVIDAYEGRFA